VIRSQPEDAKKKIEFVREAISLFESGQKISVR
jgi:hypothetical protein